MHRRSYPSDLSNGQWQLLEPLLPLGCGADLRLARAVPPTEQGLRAASRDHRGYGVRGHDSPLALPPGADLGDVGRQQIPEKVTHLQSPVYSPAVPNRLLFF
jgi:hypothetical protein